MRIRVWKIQLSRQRDSYLYKYKTNESLFNLLNYIYGKIQRKVSRFFDIFYHIFIPVKLSTTIVAIARSQRLWYDVSKRYISNRYRKAVCMTKRNHTTYALLGLITAGYRTGYEMKRMIDQSLNHFWKISYGQIYPALRQLTEAGWAAASPALSDKSRTEKSTWLPLKVKSAAELAWRTDQWHRFRKNEFLLKLFFSKEESREKTALKVKEYQQKLEERLEAYKAIEQSILSCSSHSKDREYWLFTLDYGKRTTSAGIEWCEATINRLNGKEGTNG